MPLALLPGVSRAGEGIGLYEAFRMALDYHERIAMAGEDVVQQRREIKKAYAQLMPSVVADGTYTRYTEEKTSGAGGFLLQPEDSSKAELRLTQPLYTGGRAMSTLRQARKNVTAAEHLADEAREDVVIETARAYYNLLKSTREFEITSASLRRAEEQVRVSGARFNVGSATKAELLRSEADAAEKEAELARARSAVVDAEDVLRRLTGMQGAVTVTDPDLDFQTGMDVEDFVGVALGMRRDYRRSEIAEDVAGEGVKYTKGAFLPTLYAEGIYSMRAQTPETSFFLDDAAYATLNLSIPIFEGGLRRAELGQARSRLRQAELSRLALKREIELEVRRSYNRLATDRKVIEASRKQLSFAEENYAMVFKQYRYGLADNTDLIDANTTLVSAEMSLMRAAYDYELSALELKRNSGLLLNEVERVMGRAAPAGPDVQSTGPHE